MAFPTATTAGAMTGYFTIPASVPAGAKLVQFYGATSSGTYAEATFVGRGVLTINELRETTTVNLAVHQWVCPIAQTFGLEADTMLNGVDIKFAAKGTSRVLCQIRECSGGFPTDTILASAAIAQTEISTATSAWTRFSFSPVLLYANQDYAITLLCDDATTAVRIATLGDFDSYNQQWITEQAYKVGVLLKSSNAVTWTDDQTSDLAFRLLQPTYTPVSSAGVSTAIITMTSTSVTSADYLFVMAAVERPMVNTDCVFELKTYPTTATTAVYSVTEGQPLLLATQYSGAVDCSAFLTGTLHASPKLYKDIQIISGKGRTSGTYISRTIPCNGTSASSSKMTVNLTANLPQGSALDIQAQVGTDASNLPIWSTSFIAYGDPVPVAENWYDRVYTLSGFSVTATRLKVTLTGSPQAAPLVKNLQAYCVSV